MKLKLIYKLILLSLLSFSLVGCNDNDNLPEKDKDKDKLPDESVKFDPYLSPSAPQGKILITGSDKRHNPFLGAGYDIMGDYLCSSSVKSVVLDISKMSDDEITTFRMLSSYSKNYEGTTAKEMLQSIAEKNNFEVPRENRGNLFFTGTITGELYFNKPYEYSSQYTFLCEQSDFTDIRSRINLLTAKHLLPYLSENFKEDLEYSPPEDIVEMYGTHVLTTVYLGRRIRTLYRSVVEDEGDNSIIAAKAGLEDRRSTIYKIPNVNYHPSEELVKKNIGGTIIVDFYGGDFKKLPHIQLLPNEVIGEPMNIEPWLASLNESNYALTTLDGDNMIPIYDLVADPIKKQQIKEAVSTHIRAKQLDDLETTPIFQQWNGKQNRYFASYQDFKNRSEDSSTLDGAIGSLLLKQYPGTIPLYLYSNGKNERFSLKAELTDRGDMEYQGIAGYVYKEYQSNSFNVVYEITNGHSFAYTTESKETYGEKGTWKKTGNEFYSKKISL